MNTKEIEFELLPSEGLVTIKCLAAYFKVAPGELFEKLNENEILVLNLTDSRYDGLVNLKEIYNKTLTEPSKSVFSSEKQL